VGEVNVQMKQRDLHTRYDVVDPKALPLDVLAFIFTYLSPQTAMCIRRVSRKWHGVQTLHRVPWIIGPNGFLDAPHARLNVTKGNLSNMLDSGYTKNAIEFRFGSMAPTRALVQCIEGMPRLRRMQMPSHTNGRPFRYRDLEILTTSRTSNITHLAVSLRSCILSVCRFSWLTSLLVSYGAMMPIASFVSVEALLRTIGQDDTVLSELQHLGLHHAAKTGSDLSVNRIADLLERRSKLITLSLTGHFHIGPRGIGRLLHPVCGLRSLAVHIPDDNGGNLWKIGDLLGTSDVSLFVICLSNSVELISKSLLWALFGSGFEPLRARFVNIDGQRSYMAHPFKRSGSVGIVWGLTGGSIFANTE
jgi:hypothetical protein